MTNYNKDFLDNIFPFLEGKFADNAIIVYSNYDENNEVKKVEKEFGLQNYKEYCVEFSEYASLKIDDLKWTTILEVKKEVIPFRLIKKM